MDESLSQVKSDRYTEEKNPHLVSVTQTHIRKLGQGSWFLGNVAEFPYKEQCFDPPKCYGPFAIDFS